MQGAGETDHKQGNTYIIQWPVMTRAIGTHKAEKKERKCWERCFQADDAKPRETVKEQIAQNPARAGPGPGGEATASRHDYKYGKDVDTLPCTFCGTST